MAEMLAKQQKQQPQHKYNVVSNGAPTTNPAPQPAPPIMKDNTAELRRIAELEMANTTLHDQNMRQGNTFRQRSTSLRVKMQWSTNELNWHHRGN